MCGRHTDFIPRHVFTDEGQELPLLASRTAGRQGNGWPGCEIGEFETAKCRAHDLDCGFHGVSYLQRGLHHDGIIVNKDQQLLDGIPQQGPRFDAHLAKAAILRLSPWVDITFLFNFFPRQSKTLPGESSLPNAKKSR